MTKPSEKGLEAALAYRNEDVIARFLKLYDIPPEEAEELFVETLKWMWLLNEANECLIYPEMLMLDEMWHNFVLFTHDYSEYCIEYLGSFLDHQPATVAAAKEHDDLRASDPKAAKAAYLAAYEKQLEATVDLLGEETALRWHAEYRNRYDVEFFATRRKSAGALHRLTPDQVSSLSDL